MSNSTEQLDPEQVIAIGTFLLLRHQPSAGAYGGIRYAPANLEHQAEWTEAATSFVAPASSWRAALSHSPSSHAQSTLFSKEHK